MRRVAPEQLELEVTKSEPRALPRRDGRHDPWSADARMPAHCDTSSTATVPHRPAAAELLETPGALLTRSHLRQLGLQRRAIDAIFRALPVVALPGYSRPMIRAAEYLALVDENTYRDDRVRPCGVASLARGIGA
jgi:hypothetical protein